MLKLLLFVSIFIDVFEILCRNWYVLINNKNVCNIMVFWVFLEK